MSTVVFTEQTSTDASQKTTSTLKILKADQANRTWTDHALARSPLREARPQPCRTTPRLLRPLRVAGFPSGCFLLSESQLVFFGFCCFRSAFEVSAVGMAYHQLLVVS